MTSLSLSDRLQRLIATSGPITVERYMAEANAHYYTTRDPLGAAGDFVTAPEISQMFGELVGLALADLWDRAGRPDGARYVELGPGRGTLAADALRAMRAAGLEPPVHFVEASPVLRAAQAKLLPKAAWHDDLSTLPGNGPILAVANEFFDALPARQLVAGEDGWRERAVTFADGRFVPVPGPLVAASAIPASAGAPPPGTIWECSPASLDMIGRLARRLAEQGGGALIFDYGHDRSSAGDTLQAVKMHRYADCWTNPGEHDLTVHVDFESLATAARAAGVGVHGPVAQGIWLGRLGLDARASTLSRQAPGRAGEVAAAHRRLTASGEMGTLFRVLSLSAPGWPEPEGFR